MTTITNLVTSPVTGRGMGGVRSTVSWARATGTDVYTAGDVYADGSGDPVSIKFDGVGRSGLIHQARIILNESDTISWELYVFDAEPTGVADNGALSLDADDMSALVTVFSFSNTDKITMVTGYDTFFTPPASAGIYPVPYASSDGNLYGHLVVRTGYTPTSLARVWVSLGVELT